LDFRQFRIDRIQAAQLETVPEQLAQTPIQNSGIKSVIQVLVKTREISERFKQSELRVDTQFEFQSFSRQWIERSILASGNAVALQSPPEIRKSISQVAQSILDRYKGR
jgi:predicted DNA-binding transcriptional regulator YafY